MPHPTVGNFVNKEKCAPLGSFGIWASPYALSWQPLIARNYLLNFRCAFCLILYIKWNLVVRGRRFLCTYSTVLQICCTCAVNKNTWRITGTRRDEGTHAPRAHEGHSPTGISRPRTEVLRASAYFSAANTLLRSRASRGHLNLCITGVSFSCRTPTLFCAHCRQVLS